MKLAQKFAASSFAANFPIDQAEIDTIIFAASGRNNEPHAVMADVTVRLTPS